jgi:hypothetical protein
LSGRHNPHGGWTMREAGLATCRPFLCHVARSWGI